MDSSIYTDRESLRKLSQDHDRLFVLEALVETGLNIGELLPLAFLLEAKEPIDQALRKRLAKMIKQATDDDYILTIAKHPKFVKNMKTDRDKRKTRDRNIDIAIWMLRNGIENTNLYESVVEDAFQKFTKIHPTIKRRSVIRTIWSNNQSVARLICAQMDSATEIF